MPTPAPSSDPSMPPMMPAGLPLSGRVALVTGVSRDIGIAATVATRLHDLGATVFATGWPAHDAEMPWGEQPLSSMPFEVHRHDLEDPNVPHQLVDEVVAAHGSLDIVIATHARSSKHGLAGVDALELDRCWAANVRSIILLAQHFAEVHSPVPQGEAPTGRMVWFTSGQHLQPMHGELAYAVTKGALHQMTASVDRALSEHRIVANCINPGPVDTGYATGDFRQKIADMFPDGEWGFPDNVADLVEFLVSEKGAWMRGQVLNSEGGFYRYA